MKKILGLDPGTNSIGWGVIDADKKEIVAAGSRIIPLTQDVIGDFEKGKSAESAASSRTKARQIRRMHERKILRRERLHKALGIMNFLPEHYASQLDKYGKIIPNKEPKLAWRESDNGKMEFIFMDSFNEMLIDFAKYQPELLLEGRSIPYDWTVYYLRKKGLSSPLTKQELAWVLLQMNQKRGYYQLRDDAEEDNPTQKKEYLTLTVARVEKTDENKGDAFWYNIFFEEREDLVYRRTSKYDLDWIGKKKDFVVTYSLEKDGTVKLDKSGSPKYSIKLPEPDDWGLVKAKTESLIDQSKLHLGSYIYNSLLQRPSQKILGQLVRIVDRQYYKREAYAIINKQKEFIPELSDNDLYKQVIEALYPSNDPYRSSIANRDFVYLLVDDILFYQRKLRSKKGLVENCPFENRSYQDKATNKTIRVPVKCIAKSNPFFQEYRLWQFISNLKIYKRDAARDLDVTSTFLPTSESITKLFDWLNSQASVKQDGLLKFLVGKSKDDYRWNYVEGKEYPCNKTRAQIAKGIKKAGLPADYLTREREQELWHIIYSITDKIEYSKAIAKYATKNQLGDAFIEVFSNMKPFEEKDYGAYSEKAIKRLLPLMRMGKYWSVDDIDKHTIQRINTCINGEADDSISAKVRELMAGITSIDQCCGMSTWAACYLVYNCHSEAAEATKWDSPTDIDQFLKDFKHNSLRNPIVEQVVLETMRTVRDIWKQVGQIDEIHVEIGRDLKNSKEQRARISQQNAINEEENLRIRYLLAEMADPEFNVDDVRPNSPSQQEILRIYEEDAWSSISEPPKEIAEIRKIIGNTDPKKRPTKKQVLRYKCWLDQKYLSPYTGQPIPLSKLFTPAYQIEHVIPQARFFDDSYNNKVICEAEVNALKGKSLGMEFIHNNPGRIVTLTGGRTATILHKAAYTDLVKKMFATNRAKLARMLMDDIPEEFVERQLNDSRYISRYILSLLSNIVRTTNAEGNLEPEAVSKNVIVCNGKVTTRLKKDWGVGDVWNRIIIDRFIRMADLDKDHQYIATSSQGHTIPDIPLELRKGFDKKRLDHRHHAMDAIVIACCTRDHVNLLNNESALSKDSTIRYDLSRKLRNYQTVIVNGEKKSVPQEFKMPWTSFPADLQNSLQSIIVSFKQNHRVINKATNWYQVFKNGKKVRAKQLGDDLWAIRRPLHKNTFFGEVNLKFTEFVSLPNALKTPSRIVDADIRHKVQSLLKDGLSKKEIISYFKDHCDIWSDVISDKIEVYFMSNERADRYFATRFGNDLVSMFSKITSSEKAISVINKVTDSGIRKILMAHLASEGMEPDKAFSPEGVDRMNANIEKLNDGKMHKPIYVVRSFEKASKFPVGSNGNKGSKYVEAAQGTLLFMVFYTTPDEPNKRKYYTLPFNLAVNIQKQYHNGWKEHLDDYLKQNNPELELPALPQDAEILFILSVGDLVLLPMPDGTVEIKPDRIYKAVSFGGSTCDFVPHRMAAFIHNDLEYTIHHKQQKAITGEMVKEICVPIQVDRLGNIISIWKK